MLVEGILLIVYEIHCIDKVRNIEEELLENIVHLLQDGENSTEHDFGFTVFELIIFILQMKIGDLPI